MMDVKEVQAILDKHRYMDYYYDGEDECGFHVCDHESAAQEIVERVKKNIIYEGTVAWQAATFLMQLNNHYKAKGIRVIVLRNE